MNKTRAVSIGVFVFAAAALAMSTNGCKSSSSGGSGGAGGTAGAGGSTGGTGGGGGHGGGGAGGGTGGAATGGTGGATGGTGGHIDGGAGADGSAGSGGSAGSDAATAPCGTPFAPTDAGAPDGGFHAAIQNLVNTHCVMCHSNARDGGPASGLDWSNVTNVVTNAHASVLCGPGDGGADAGGKLIVSPNHPEISYMVDKVIGHAQNCPGTTTPGAGCFNGSQMPFRCNLPDGGPFGLTCLTNDDIQTIVNWIATGAQ